jgi:hypothetical protein
MRGIRRVPVCCLAACVLGCVPAELQDAIVGRWHAADGSDLRCDFTEDGTMRLGDDSGQSVGTYTVEEGWIRLHLGRHGSTTHAWRSAYFSHGTLTLEACDRTKVPLRRQ